MAASIDFGGEIFVAFLASHLHVDRGSTVSWSAATVVNGRTSPHEYRLNTSGWPTHYILPKIHLMPTPDWRAEKSAVLIQQICHALQQARPKDGSPVPEKVCLSRAELGALLWNSTKLYCDAKEESNDDAANTWSPELPQYLLDHPDKCDETLGLVADKDYRDPYYDGLGEKGGADDE